MSSKEIVPLFLMLPGLGDVYGNPSIFGFEEIGPAVIAGNLRRMFVGWQRKANFKPRRNALRTHHGDEKRMEISAVALLGVASVQHIAAPPAGAGFVVTHGGEDVVVDGSRLLQRRRPPFGLL